VPAWALTPTQPDADLSGRAWTIIAFGPGGTDIAQDWVAQITSAGGGSAVRLHRVDAGQGIEELTADLDEARVGWRLMMAGPADACLQLRGAATGLGVADDEMTVASTDVDSRAVHCVHCGAVTRARVQLDEVLPCESCGRKLLVYYHVSRRGGTYMGFMVDAEEPAEVAS
jgi:dimethylamine monooxygenase subunit C